MALNFDTSLVPYPPYEFQLAMNKVDGVGQDDLGKRTPHGISWHRGVTGNQTLDGAVSYLIARSTRGLTDGYIDNMSGRVVIMNPMAELFPEVHNLVPNWADRAGWANGPYQSNVAASDAKAFVARYGARLGANIVNQDLESYEILGNYDTPISDKCKRVIAQIAANRAQRNKIPWNTWPVNPASGITEMFGHREFCGTAYKLCPGGVVWAFINGPLVGMVRDILKQAQVDGKRVSVDGAVVPVPSPTPVTEPEPTPKKKFATIRFESLLRTSPGFWDYSLNKSNVIATLPAGTRGEVIDGPRVAEGITWYDLKLDNGATGWVADTVLHTMNIQEAA